MNDAGEHEDEKQEEQVRTNRASNDLLSDQVSFVSGLSQNGHEGTDHASRFRLDSGQAMVRSEENEEATQPPPKKPKLERLEIRILRPV